ncbi:MAG: glycosyltransferase [Clostridia bacterium]|nr:glycosyltransferase [Clostridia bacterium]
MNVLLMSLMYPEDQMEEVTQNAKDKLQNQINSYQRAFVEGIRQNLQESEKLHILNCLPVGIFPLQYRQLVLKSGSHDQGTIMQIGCINLPWFKQQMRMHLAERELIRLIEASPENRTVLVYTQYLPYMQAIVRAKKRFPDLKAAVIVTDLPNDLGLASGRKGLMKKIEYKRGDESLRLLRQMDGFVLLTEPMADALQIREKPYTVIEGLILKKTEALIGNDTAEEKPVVLYTGTLEPGLGIAEMLEAFRNMPDYDLWICGQGSMQAEVQKAADTCENIMYYGFVPQQKALALQARASALINPRQPSGIFTKYSFPSKTLEYMRSGKPTLCCRLEGIPADYEPYLCFIDEVGSTGIEKAVRKLMVLSQEEQKRLGESARNYVLEHKNPMVQCRKLMALLRQL